MRAPPAVQRRDTQKLVYETLCSRVRLSQGEEGFRQSGGMVGDVRFDSKEVVSGIKKVV